MEELIPFVFFILWVLFGTIGSKKKREEAQRQAEVQREQAEAARRARAEQRRASRESREPDGQTFADARDDGLFTSSPGSTGGGTAGGSGDSLDMIPDELWSILTGGAPRPTPAPRQPEAEPETPGGWVTSPPWDEEDAVHSIEGVSAETTSENALDYDDDADRFARARYEQPRATSWDDRGGMREVLAARADETSEQRHVEFHDMLTQDEIGRRAADVAPISARERLGLRTSRDVRRAIVLAEILGPPKSLR